MDIVQRQWILRAGLFAGVAVVITCAYWWQQKPADRAASLTPPASTTHIGVSLNKPHDNINAPAVGKSPPVIQGPSAIRQRMKTAKDYYALAKELLPQAQAGDPEAQYVLFMTYRMCFDSSGIERKYYENVNAVRENAIKYGLSVDDAVYRYQQCHGFNTDDAKSLGDPWDWLQKATNAGYPMAQAQTASERFLQNSLKAAVRAGGSPTDPTVNLPPIGGDADPRDLLTAAVQSGDPDVLIEIANLQLRLNPTQPRDVITLNSIAWRYIACQRGADCSAYGPETMTNCAPTDSQCAPVPERFLSTVNNDWAPVQERVNQINAALNAKQWDQLPGLTPGG